MNELVNIPVLNFGIAHSKFGLYNYDTITYDVMTIYYYITIIVDDYYVHELMFPSIMF